jgi:protein TonB
MNQAASPKPINRLAAWCADADERLRFMLVLALALHALIILLVGFDALKTEQSSKALEITFALNQDSQAPIDPAYLAQHHQLGQGDSQTNQDASVVERALFTSDKINQLSAQISVQSGTGVTPSRNEGRKDQTQQKRSGTNEVLTTSGQALLKANQELDSIETLASNPLAGDSTSLLNASKEIASLEARLKDEQQKLQSRSRTGRVTSLSTLAKADALYLERWRQKIETIGNLNYPIEARNKGIEGSLQMLVTLSADGSVKQLEVLKSSGYSILDDAAVRTVRTASPFEPFPIEMRQRLDRLEIIRTWKFEKNTQVY